MNRIGWVALIAMTGWLVLALGSYAAVRSVRAKRAVAIAGWGFPAGHRVFVVIGG
jgi:hypothetical protein